MDLLDVVVEVEVEVSRLADVLGIGTGLSADDIKDRGGDNLDMTDLAIFSPGRSKFPPFFLRSKNNMGIFGENILVFSTNVWLFANIFGKNQTCV